MHYKEIDFLKGLGIILVVVTHALSYNTSAHIGEDSVIRTILYELLKSFLMPMFFCVSGFLDGIGKDKKTYVKKKINRVLIPYFVVGVLYFPFKMILSSYARYPGSWRDLGLMFVGRNPDGGLWYLYALFVIGVFCRLCVTEKTINLFLLPSFLLGVVIGNFEEFYLVSWYMIPRVLFFYLLGLKARQMQGNKIWNRVAEKCQSIPVLIFEFLLFIGLFFANFYQVFYVNLVPVVALAAIAFHVTLANILKYSEQNILCRIGRDSMGIYILHGPIQVVVRTALWSVLHLGYWTVVVSKFVIGFVGGWIATWIVRRFRFLRKVMLGE